MGIWDRFDPAIETAYRLLRDTPASTDQARSRRLDGIWAYRSAVLRNAYSRLLLLTQDTLDFKIGRCQHEDRSSLGRRPDPAYRTADDIASLVEECDGPTAEYVEQELIWLARVWPAQCGRTLINSYGVGPTSQSPVHVVYLVRVKTLAFSLRNPPPKRPEPPGFEEAEEALQAHRRRTTA